jgi:hypothetical protein
VSPPLAYIGRMKHIPITRADAEAFGLKRFYTGQPCQWGHDAERYTCDGGCVECHRNPTSQCSARELARRYAFERAARAKP